MNKKIELRRFFFYLIPLLILPSLSWAWQGKVVGISDGDTITVLHNNKGEKVRLYGIDTPEKRQDFGNKAKQFTSDMVFGKHVEVEPITKDRYGRTVGLVYINGQCLNEELVRAGFAWVYVKYCEKKAICSVWRHLEATVQANKTGLWSHLSPIPPWVFRHGKSRGSHTDYTKQAANQSVVYRGNVKSKMFHEPGCRYYNCKNCTAVFNNKGEAISWDIVRVSSVSLKMIAGLGGLTPYVNAHAGRTQAARNRPEKAHRFFSRLNFPIYYEIL